MFIITNIVERMKFVGQASQDLFRNIYIAFIQPNKWTFLFSVLLNFNFRALNLLAFIYSIQALLIAFDFVVAGEEGFRGKAILEYLDLAPSLLPVLLSLSVLLVFSLPALSKMVEMKLLSKIAYESSSFVSRKGLDVSTDVYVIQKLLALLFNIARFFSGALFILVALVVVAFFKVTLFLFIFIASVAISSIVVLTGLKNIIETAKVGPFKVEYIKTVREGHAKKTLDEIPTTESENRGLYIDLVSKNWIKNNSMVVNQGILMGAAISVIVFYVFSLEEIGEDQMFLLIYMAIAIRYSINTARETGSMLTKIFEARLDVKHIKAVADARTDNL